MNGVAVIGTSMIDLVVIGRQVFEMEHCNKAQIVRSFGGSMHNVAYNCGCLGLETHFVSKFGRDDAGLAIVNELQKKRVSFTARSSTKAHRFSFRLPIRKKGCTFHPSSRNFSSTVSGKIFLTASSRMYLGNHRSD